MAELPTAWREELLARHARDHPEHSITLELSYFPDALADWLDTLDLSRQEFDADLRSVLSFRRDDKRRDDKRKSRSSVPYYVETQLLSLTVVDRIWRIEDGYGQETGEKRKLAQIKAVERRQRLLPDVAPDVTVITHTMYEAREFDLADAYQRYLAALAAASAAVSDAQRGIIMPVSASRRSRITLDRELLSARAVLELAAHRESVVQAREFPGIVSGGDASAAEADVLQVQLDAATSALAEDADVILSGPGSAADDILAEVVDVTDAVALLRPKKYADLERLPPPGCRVLLTRHVDERAGGPTVSAINRMLDGRVAGAWGALTTLLTRPDLLPPVPDPGELIVTDPELSPEQREAVRRAVTARHAFFIQGPPGTGKTTVIKEIVRQLAMRGERVLVAAQMHVAVDELLSRVHDDPLVWPMRVSRRQDLVDEKLQDLWEDAVGGRTAAKVLSQTSALTMEWPLEIDRLQHRRAVIAQMRKATVAAAQADEELRQARESGQRERLEQELVWGERAITEAGSRIADLADAARSAAETVAETQRMLATTDAAVTFAARERSLAQRDRQAAHAAAMEALRASAAAKRAFDAAAEQVRSLGERHAALGTELARITADGEASWRRDVTAFCDYLASLDERRGNPHTRPSATVLAARDRLARAQAGAQQLKAQTEQAAAVLRARYDDAQRAGSRLRQDEDAANQALAGFESQYAAAGLVGKALHALGVGALPSLESEAAAMAAAADAALIAFQSRSKAVGAAQEALANVAKRLERAQRVVRDAQSDLFREAALDADAVVAAARNRDMLTTARARLTSQLSLPAAIAELTAVSRHASPQAPGLAGIAAKADLLAAQLTQAGAALAARVAQAEAAVTSAAAHENAARGAQDAAAAEAERRRIGAASARTRLAAATNAEADRTAAEQRARSEKSRLEDALAEALAAQRAAQASLAPLTARRAQLGAALELARGRLAAVTAQLDSLAERADTAQTARDDAVSAALTVCAGQLPADIDADDEESQARIERLSRLINLQYRWQEMVAEASFTSPDLPGEFGRTLLDATNLVCSTAAGINGSKAARDADFDTLILDEASRVTDIEFLVPAVRCRRWILVGDERQLPPYVDQETEQHVYAMLALSAAGETGSLDDSVRALADEHDQLLPRRPLRREAVADLAARMLADGSWADRYKRKFDEELGLLADGFAALPGGGKPSTKAARKALIRTLAQGFSLSRFEQCVEPKIPDSTRKQLTMQRRMIAPIAELVKGPVYDGKYVTPDEDVLKRKGIIPYVGGPYSAPVTFYDTPRAKKPRSVGTGFANDLEAAMVVGLLHQWDEIAGTLGLPAHPTYSVLSFYKAQAALIERLVARHPPRNLRRRVIDSIDKIQGQESDLVVISFVRALRNDRGAFYRPKPGNVLWLQDIHRLNVAVTRAKMALALVGDRRTLQALRGRKQAEEFYANLFRLADSTGNDAAFPGGFEYVLEADL